MTNHINITEYLENVVDFYRSQPEVAKIVSDGTVHTMRISFLTFVSNAERVDKIHEILENDGIEHKYSKTDMDHYYMSNVTVNVGDEIYEICGSTKKEPSKDDEQ